LLSYNAHDGQYAYEGILYEKDYPVYFKHLLSEKMIVASDAENDGKTKEFTENYLKPNAIKSMMDIPFFIDGKFKGIICCEEQRDVKKWNEIDILFAQTITMYISIVFYCAMRKEQNYSLEVLTESLRQQNQKLNSINYKILSDNGSLINDLDWKSKNLSEIKTFLSDLSYRNAHHLRAPLSRILGLVYLYTNDPDIESKDSYMEFISQSAYEMDRIIREISDELNRKPD
jgi:hypothetical protein